MQQPRNVPPSPLPLLPDGTGEPRADCHVLLERLPDWAMAYVRDLLQDKVMCRVNRYYYACILSGLLIPALAGWAVTGEATGALTGLMLHRMPRSG